MFLGVYLTKMQLPNIIDTIHKLFTIVNKDMFKSLILPKVHYLQTTLIYMYEKKCPLSTYLMQIIITGWHKRQEYKPWTVMMVWEFSVRHAVP